MRLQDNKNGSKHNKDKQNCPVTTSTAVSLSVTFEQTIERIHELSESEWSSEDKEWLQEQIGSPSLPKNKKDNDTFWNKAKPVLAKVADKGFELAKIALPLVLKLMMEITDQYPGKNLVPF